MNRLLKTISFMMITMTLFIVSGCEKENLFYRHEYVDLGLPSGNLWATCNVGADSPEEYGDYFAWGETEPKSLYSLDTYKYRDSVPYSSLGIDTLRASDDAACAQWGGSWHTPNFDEWNELCNNTNIEEMTMNGVKGLCFNGNNGNSIFLPFAGDIVEDDLYAVGDVGCYWISNGYAGDFRSIFQCFHNYIENHATSYGDGPVYNGCSIRPVRSSE